MDAYDMAVAYLTERPEEIYDAWVRTKYYPAGILFSFVSPDRIGNGRATCGCLTQIRGQRLMPFVAIGANREVDHALTQAILCDKELPDNSNDITPSNLPRFAEWQRTIDLELGREPPVWTWPAVAEMAHA